MMPATMLKNVVLPGAIGADDADDRSPCGTIEVHIADRDQAAETLGHATSALQQDLGRARRGVATVGLSPGRPVGHSGAAPIASPWAPRTLASSSRVQLPPPPAAREQTFRSQQHHRDERDAVQQELVLDEVDLGEDVADDREVPTLSKKRLSCFSSTFWILYRMNAPSATPQTFPMPPSTTMARMVNDTREPEQARADEGQLAGEEHAGEPGGRRTQRERQQLGHDRVDAACRGRQLVLADGHPGPPSRLSWRR